MLKNSKPFAAELYGASITISKIGDDESLYIIIINK